MSSRSKLLITLLVIGLLSLSILAQSGVRPNANASGGVMISVVARRDNKQTNPVTSKEISVYDNGMEQSIRNFTPDPSPARIVLLVDNSLTIRADVEKLEQAAREFAYEIYEGDKLLIVGYDEQAEIVSDWTDDSKAIESSLKLFRKKGQPYLFDAIRAVVEEALRPMQSQKRSRPVRRNPRSAACRLQKSRRQTRAPLVPAFQRRRESLASCRPAGLCAPATDRA